MPVLVQKFGGTSVSTPERRSQAIGHVRRALEAGYQVAVVVSAMGRRGDPYATDTLLDLLREDRGPVDPRDHDMIFACGELISTVVFSHFAKREGIAAVGLSGGQAGIFTSAGHAEAEIVEIDPSRLLAHLARGEVPVIAGCQGIHRETGDVTTLGRGGSDTSGVAVGVALRAAKAEIFTDVEGVARANPRAVPDARFLGQISYARMLEMARYGAGVVHPRSVRTGRDGGVPVVVRSTFSSAQGTTIADVQDEHPILGIASFGPLRSVAVEDAAAEPGKRQQWERSRLVMSLVDASTGALVLGASPERREELRAAQAELGTAGSELAGEQAWVSLIGEREPLVAAVGPALRLLEREGIGVLYHEVSEMRVTFVTPADREGQAVLALYRSLL